MEDDDRRARAEERRTRVILNKTHLAARETDLTPIWGADAISLVAILTRESWSLTGRENPTYTRREIPIRAIRGRLT